MRKIHLQQIQNVIAAIKEAQSAGLYGDCQEGALSLCDFIDETAGTGTKTVKLLEEYCELLFKANNGRIGEKFLQKHFAGIETGIARELKPNKIELAFLSYKASMGDTLESIYLAAEADPGCDAYFIPIPYYERQSDRTLGKLHYEAVGCYDNDIKLTDWQTYNIEERRPDVIFFYNPYDENNLVTSVHPQFYSGRLRQFTDLLVYIPYFGSVGGQTMEQLVTTNGCIYAHKVILPTEASRNRYVSVFKEQFGDRFGTPEEKFVLIGNPKFDKVQTKKREDYTLPQEWQQLSQNKKSVLYNTSLAAILKDTENYLKKLAVVLEYFKNNNDLILWWRPHPLSDSTFDSMRPQLRHTYKKIVADYKQAAYGIYDDTPNLHRAIARTDAYYGDASSVETLYTLSGKPLLQQNTEILPADDFRIVPTYFMCTEDEEIYFNPMYLNMLLKADKTGTVEYLGKFPDEVGYTGALYQGIAKVGGNIYFAPYIAEEIAVYSLTTRSFEKIPYENKIDGEKAPGAFNHLIPYGDYVFFMPQKYSAIIRLNTKTKEIDYYPEFYNMLKEQGVDVKAPDFYVFTNLVLDSVFYMTSSKSNLVLEFNMDTCKCTAHSVGKSEYSYLRMCFDGENYWLSPALSDKTPLVKWHPDKGVIQEFWQIYEKEENRKPLHFMEFHYFDGNVYLLPYSAKDAFKVNVHTDEIGIAEEFAPACSGLENETYRFFQAKMVDGYLYATGYTQSIFIFNLAAGTYEELPFKYSPETLQAAEVVKKSVFVPEHSEINHQRSENIVRMPTLRDLCHHLTTTSAPDTNEHINLRRQAAKRLLKLPNTDLAGIEILNFVKAECF